MLSLGKLPSGEEMRVPNSGWSGTLQVHRNAGTQPLAERGAGKLRQYVPYRFGSVNISMLHFRRITKEAPRR